MESGGTDRRNGVHPPKGGRAAFSARTRQLTPLATETATRLAGQDAPVPPAERMIRDEKEEYRALLPQASAKKG